MKASRFLFVESYHLLLKILMATEETEIKLKIRDQFTPNFLGISTESPG